MERIRYIDRPHLYLCKLPCGCKIWAVRRPVKLNPVGFHRALVARNTAKAWNLNRAMGAKPCERHNPILEQQP